MHWLNLSHRPWDAVRRDSCTGFAIFTEDQQVSKTAAIKYIPKRLFLVPWFLSRKHVSRTKAAEEGFDTALGKDGMQRASHPRVLGSGVCVGAVWWGPALTFECP